MKIWAIALVRLGLKIVFFLIYRINGKKLRYHFMIMKNNLCFYLKLLVHGSCCARSWGHAGDDDMVSSLPSLMDKKPL